MSGDSSTSDSEAETSGEVANDRGLEISRRIRNWIASGHRRASIVEEKTFQNLISALDPNYCVPSALELSAMVRSTSSAAKSEPRDLCLEAGGTSSIALSLCYAANSNRFLVLGAYFVTTSWEIKSVSVGCFDLESQSKATHENVLKWIDDRLQDLKISPERLIAIVHSDGDCVQTCAKNFAKSHGCRSLRCYHSALNCLIMEMRNQCFEPTSLGEIKKTVNFFTHSSVGKMLLNQLGNPRYSTMQTDTENAKESVRKVQRTVQPGNISLNLNIVHTLFDVLRPLEVLWSYLDNTLFVPSSVVPVLLFGLKDKCGLGGPDSTLDEQNLPDSGSFQSMKIDEKLKRSLFQKLQNLTAFSGSDVITIATALDPRWKKLPLIDSIEKQSIRNALISKCSLHHRNNTMPRGSSKTNRTATDALLLDIMKRGAGMTEEKHEESNRNVASYRIENEVLRYFDEEPPNCVTCPFEWWRVNQSRYPLLAEVARSYLCVPAVATSLSKPDKSLFSR